MREQSDGSLTHQNNDERSCGSNSSPRNNNRNNRNRQQQSRFEGSCAELRGSVYDITGDNNTYALTTRNIAEHIARTYHDAGEFRRGLMDLKLPPLQAPTRPQPNDAGNPPDVMDIEEWRLERREYAKRENLRRVNSWRAYALIIGQCSQPLRDRLEADADWNDIDTESDPIRLLQLIRKCMGHAHAIFEPKPIHSFIQPAVGVPNHKYCGKFKDLVKQNRGTRVRHGDDTRLLGAR